MRVLPVFVLLLLGQLVSSSASGGSSALTDAVSQRKALSGCTAPDSTRPTSRQSTTFENIPICDEATGKQAVKFYSACDGCIKQLLQADMTTPPDNIEDTCPEACCGDYSVQSVDTAHFIHCKDGCCARSVEQQIAQDSTPEQIELASQMRIIINNEYTVTGAGDFDRCTLNEVPSEEDACGPRCAYLFNDPGRCEGFATINVPVFGQSIDPANPPCPPPELDDEDTDDGETETDSANESDSDNPEAGSKDPEPSDGESGISDVCIDARALRHLRPEELVFDKHTLAHVMCDANASCSTPGHVVVFRGRSMMMRTYCQLVGCSKKLMYVNSPRFSRRVRVPSNTDSLEFTAFTARYETRAEEFLISAAVRAGL